MPSGRVPSGQCYSAPRPFRRFRSMDYATKFHQNFDAMCITKALDQDPPQQLSRASSSLSPLLVASDGECFRATFLQPASLVEESNRHQGAVLRCVQRAVHLGLVTEVLMTWCFMKEELCPLHKHHPRLVLFCVPSSIARLRKVIQFLYGFGCGKGEIGIAMTADNTSGRAHC